MRWKICEVMVMVLLVMVFFDGVSVANQPPPEGGVLPKFELPVPETAKHRQYLGLDQKTVFSIPDIEAEVVIIEIFSMYCPHCQREAPTVNKLFQKLEADPKTKGKIKLIGIGVGNSDFEIDYFRKTYDVPFPLFSDGDFAIHRLLGEVRTPYFIGIRILPDGSHRVFYSKLGGSEDAGKLLQDLLSQSGL
ncbi:MAG: TlpA disulfide reductase family protein [Desulfobacterales bacterium]|jgi:thiol-disulfide isomerase/thioredoxin